MCSLSEYKISSRISVLLCVSKFSHYFKNDKCSKKKSIIHSIKAFNYLYIIYV